MLLDRSKMKARLHIVEALGSIQWYHPGNLAVQQGCIWYLQTSRQLISTSSDELRSLFYRGVSDGYELKISGRLEGDDARALRRGTSVVTSITLCQAFGVTTSKTKSLMASV